MKLAIAQMTLGALSIGNYVVGVYRLPWAIPAGYRLILFPCFNVFLVLGLAVLGCGIAQYLKARVK